MSKACYNCPLTPEDCNRHHCIAADGVERGVVAINRQIPGPSIQVSNFFVTNIPKVFFFPTFPVRLFELFQCLFKQGLPRRHYYRWRQESFTGWRKCYPLARNAHGRLRKCIIFKVQAFFQVVHLNVWKSVLCVDKEMWCTAESLV